MIIVDRVPRWVKIIFLLINGMTRKLFNQSMKVEVSMPKIHNFVVSK